METIALLFLKTCTLKQILKQFSGPQNTVVV